MNKKILISLAVIGVVAAIAIGGTIAYFSDTETSTGNTFTAGKLDLIFRKEVSLGQWEEVLGEPLFTVTDMKPGDSDEVTVDLVVDNNPACGKVTINVTSDKDNSCTEPELLDDTTCSDPDGDGELNDQVNFLVWKDNGAGANACNNVLDTDETSLVSGPLTGNVVYSIGDLPTTTPDCYGIAYCFGAWVVGTPYTCDGQNVNNAAQTDSFAANLIIDALQKRHQYEPNCPAVGPWTP